MVRTLLLLTAASAALTADAVVIHRHFGRRSAGFGPAASVDYPVDYRIAWALDEADRAEAERTFTVIGNVMEVGWAGTVTIRPNGGVTRLVASKDVVIPGAGERHAADAWHHLKKLIGGRRVSLEYNRQTADGCLVGLMKCGKADVGLRMIKDGYAKAGPDAPAAYHQAEAAAKSAGLGMWAPPLVLPAPAPETAISFPKTTNSVPAKAVSAVKKPEKAR